ncbi:hypothetical protein [Anaerorhabdus sp.]|jgi:hypothetical protein|uniref:hypothetical protein n=1 Tax=Anaerorhabdus sp. TaxID=1872524 RepID=UPI002FC6E01C
MEIRFSYVGLIFLVMLIIPNIIWSKNLPKDYDKYSKNENKLLLVFEKTGEVLVTCSALIFTNFNPNQLSMSPIILLFIFILMILYEVYWIKYFKSNKTMKDLSSSLLGIPVAGATLPALSFFLLSVYGNNILLMIAAIIFRIGHIGIHLNHYKELSSEIVNLKLIILKIIATLITILGLSHIGIFIYLLFIESLN